MFLNITEDDIRMNCPHTAPMTLRAFNKISPRKISSSVLNPYEIPRYAPTSASQYSKTLLQQTPRSSQNTIVTNLEATQLATEIAGIAGAENFVDNVGEDEDPGVGGLAMSALLAVAQGMVYADALVDSAAEATEQARVATAPLIDAVVDAAGNAVSSATGFFRERNELVALDREGLNSPEVAGLSNFRQTPQSVANFEDLENIQTPAGSDPFANAEKENLEDMRRKVVDEFN